MTETRVTMALRLIRIVTTILSPLALQAIDIRDRDNVAGNTNVIPVIAVVVLVGVLGGALISAWWAVPVVPVLFVLAALVWQPVACPDCGGGDTTAVGDLLIPIVTMIPVGLGALAGLVIRAAIEPGPR